MPIIEFTILPRGVIMPLQEPLVDYEEGDIDEDEFIVPKRTKNKRLARSLKRAERRAAHENYKEL